MIMVSGKATLVTGAAGLTGSYLCELLLKRNEDPDRIIVGVDNLFRGTVDNLSNCLKHPRFKFMKMSFQNFIDTFGKDVYVKLPLFTGWYEIDEVYHLAAVVPTHYFYDSPQLTFKENCLGTTEILDWCASNRSVTKFVNASSSEIYGHPGDHIPTKETDPSCYDAVERSTRWSYAEGKILTEHYASQYADKFIITHLRYANVYGERDIDNNHVIPYILNSLINDSKISLNKNADMYYRCFLHMEDCAEATYLAMHNNDISGMAYNIGTNEEISILNLLHLCSRVVTRLRGQEPKSEVILNISRPGDPKRRVLDISRAKEKLRFAPKISLNEGIERTAKWIMAQQ
jgi:nucleoside-diphosphate-sugar epimerase